MMIERGVWLVPTLAAVYHIIDLGTDGGIPAFAVEKAKRVFDSHIDSFRRARDAGVRIAAGNDGGTPGNRADNLISELKCLVQAGMSPADALDAANRSAAVMLGMSDQIGAVGKGKIADLLVLNGDPLSDISSVSKVHVVIKAGQQVSSLPA
jgi:imidazolonepropionase-like amidohydrolase